MEPSGPLRVAARFCTVVGAVGSIALSLFVGRQNSSGLLLLLFAGWVSLPFLALAGAEAASGRWSAMTKSVFYWVTVLLTLCSLAIYSRVAFGPPTPKPAAAFLLVPIAEWVVIVIFVCAAALSSRRPS